MAKVVVSIHDLEIVRLLIYQLKELQKDMTKRGLPEAEDLDRILHRFSGMKIEDDRAE